jgi:hypothetical protein
MAVSIGWAVLAAVGLGWELLCRRGHGRFPTAEAVGALISVRLVGRIVLLGGWVFIGVHVFARHGAAGG